MFSTISLLFGLGFVALGLWMRARGSASQNWPSVEGVIVESRIDGFDLDSQSPRVAYTYTVNGSEFRGTRISYSGHGTSKAAMEALIAPYPIGRVVRVFFDPESPATSVLENAPSKDWWLWMGVGAVCVVVSFFLFGKG